MYDSWVAYLKDYGAGEVYNDFTEEHRKSWDQFHEYDSQKLRSVMQTSEENKGASLGKIQVKVRRQRSPYACEFLRIDLRRRLKDRSDVPAEIGQEYLEAQRNGQCFILVTYQRMVSPSAICQKTGGKKICCRFRRDHAHVEQERPELCRIGNRKSL